MSPKSESRILEKDVRLQTNLEHVPMMLNRDVP